LRPPHGPTPFPYTPLFRSRVGAVLGGGLPVRAAVELLVAAGEIAEHGVQALRVAPELEQRPAARHGQAEHVGADIAVLRPADLQDRKSTRLNSSHVKISYA